MNVAQPMRGATLFKVINCLILIVIVAILVYDVRRTSQQHVDLQQIEGIHERQKRETQLGRNHAGNGDTTITGGAVYTRWGRSTCEGEGVELIYAGVAGGSHYSHHGGGSNYLCMPPDPQWGSYSDAVNNKAIVYGGEFEMQAGDVPFDLSNTPKLHNHNVPCAVCQTTMHSTAMMIPARRECYEGWRIEYHGYLMAGCHDHKGRTEFVCVDEKPEADPAGYRDENGALYCSTEGACGALPCPPYIAGRELTCVMCSK